MQSPPVVGGDRLTVQLDCPPLDSDEYLHVAGQAGLMQKQENDHNTVIEVALISRDCGGDRRFNEHAGYLLPSYSIGKDHTHTAVPDDRIFHLLATSRFS